MVVSRHVSVCKISPSYDAAFRWTWVGHRQNKQTLKYLVAKLCMWYVGIKGESGKMPTSSFSRVPSSYTVLMRFHFRHCLCCVSSKKEFCTVILVKILQLNCLLYILCKVRKEVRCISFARTFCCKCVRFISKTCRFLSSLCHISKTNIAVFHCL